MQTHTCPKPSIAYTFFRTHKFVVLIEVSQMCHASSHGILNRYFSADGPGVNARASAAVASSPGAEGLELDIVGPAFYAAVCVGNVSPHLLFGGNGSV